jgi:predicted O-methyltransferase YrrM
MSVVIDHKLPITRRLEGLVRNIHGWTPLDQLLSLFLLVYSTRDLDGNIVEVGSWCGRSSCALGLAAQAIGNTKVRCIDPFPEKNDWYQNADGSYSFSVTIDGEVITSYAEQTVWEAPFKEEIAPLYEQFPSVLAAFRHSVKSTGLEAVVTPHRGSLSTFLKKAPPDFKCKLAFIDGDHGYEAVKRDIRDVEHVLIPGGWLCFDDAFTNSTGVDRAISELVLASSNYELAQQLTRKLFVARRVY